MVSPVVRCPSDADFTKHAPITLNSLWHVLSMDLGAPAFGFKNE